MKYDIGKKGKYKSNYSEKLVEYFNRRGEAAGKSGLPTLAGFAESIGASLSDIFRWSDGVEEFSRALELARRCKREYILDGVLDGSISASAAKFIIDEYDSIPPAGEKGDAPFVLKVSFEDGTADNTNAGCAVDGADGSDAGCAAGGGADGSDAGCAAGGAVHSGAESERGDDHE